VFPERVIADDSLHGAPDHYAFGIRVPWYRALPLSSIDIIDLKVDNVPVDLDRVAFMVNCRRYDLMALHDLYDDWWFVTDPAEVNIAQSGGLDQGPHTIDLTLGMRIPYILAGPHVLQIQERCIKTLELS
jgi:hypothetical protein